MATVAQDSNFSRPICKGKAAPVADVASGEGRLLSALLAMNKSGCFFSPSSCFWRSPRRPRAGYGSLRSLPQGLHDRATGGENGARKSFPARPCQATFCRLAARTIEEDQRRLATGDCRLSQPQNRRSHPAGGEQNSNPNRLSDATAVRPPEPAALDWRSTRGTERGAGTQARSTRSTPRPPSRMRPGSCGHASTRWRRS